MRVSLGRVVFISARPGRIKADIRIELRHPSLYTVKSTPVFSDYIGGADRGDSYRVDQDGAMGVV